MSGYTLAGYYNNNDMKNAIITGTALIIDPSLLLIT